MGATVSVAKRVAAFKSTQGVPIYVLFESTYEKNCYPHTPHWWCYAAGTIDEVMERIFAAGAACEGGSLQGVSGCIKPESYIAGWIEALKEPVAMPNVSNTLAFGSRLGCTIPERDFYDKESLRDLVLNDLRDDGFADIAKAIEEGGYTASLHDDFDVLRSIYTRHRSEIGIGRFIKMPSQVEYSPVAAPELAYQPVEKKMASFQPPELLNLGFQERMLVKQADGSYHCARHSCDMVNDFVSRYWAFELQYPGSFRKTMRKLREAIKAAKPVTGQVTVEVTKANINPKHTYSIEQIQRLADLLGKPSTEFTISWEEAAAKEQELEGKEPILYLLCYCDELVWRVEEKSETQTQTTLFAEPV